MVRTQIQLTEEQAAKVKRLAAERGVSMAALIREAVDRIAGEGSAEDEKWKRAMAVVGKFRDKDGADNVGEEHDRYLEEAYLDWRR
jgi:hypothetical protein